MKLKELCRKVTRRSAKARKEILRETQRLLCATSRNTPGCVARYSLRLARGSRRNIFWLKIQSNEIKKLGRKVTRRSAKARKEILRETLRHFAKLCATAPLIPVEIQGKFTVEVNFKCSYFTKLHKEARRITKQASVNLCATAPSYSC